jgi:predicted metallopeptidase
MYRSNKEIVEAPEVEKIGDEVIQDKGLALDDIEIAYIKVYPNLSKTKVATCRVANHREHFFTDGADYIISVSGDIWDNLDDKRKRILIWHELEHIHFEYSETRGEYNFKTRNHDVEDFQNIIEKHGVDWFDEMKEIVASFHDMDPEKKQKIRI